MSSGWKFLALTNPEFDQALSNLKQQDYFPVTIDLGYAAQRNKSCGIAWRSLDGITHKKQVSFDKAIEEVVQSLRIAPEGAKPLLIAEAPLSMRHVKGCPAFRGQFEQAREKVSSSGKKHSQAFGWYHGPGAATTLGAMRFVQESTRFLESGMPVYLAEAFLSNKSEKTAHEDDAQRILIEFWAGKPETLFSDVEPLSGLVQGIPCVRVFPGKSR